MQEYKVTAIYHTPGPFGPVQHTSTISAYRSAAWIRDNVKNAHAVFSRAGARSLVFDLDSKKAVQVAGYSDARGLYADVLTGGDLA